MLRKIVGITTLCSTVFIGTVRAETPRIFKSQPFYSAPKWEKMESNRVSLWPLCYKNSAATSVLWPLFDYDETGFSIRPLYSQENSERSILFPLSSWDSEKKQGWVGPVWWGEFTRGVMPVYGKFGDFSYVGPYWKDRNKQGVFPFFSYENKRSDKWTYRSLFGLFSYWDKESDGKFTHWQFPGYYRHKGDSKDNLVLFPYYNFDDSAKQSQGVFPLYGISSDSNKENFSIGGGVLTYYSSKPGNSYSLWQFPNIYIEKNKDNKATCVFPYFSFENSRSQAHGVFPLYYRETSGDNDSELSIGAGLLAHVEQSGDNKSAWIFPNFYMESSPTADTSLVLPYYKWHNKTSSGHGFFPFYGYYEGDNKKLALSPVSCKFEDKNEKWMSILGPLYISHNKLNSDAKYKALLWPLVAKKDNKHFSKLTIWPLYANRADKTENRVDREVHSLAHYTSLYSYWETFDEKRLSLTPLIHYKANKMNDDSMLRLASFYRQKEGRYSTTEFWPFLKVTNDKSQSNSSLLSFNQDSGKVSASIFPFISYCRDRRNDVPAILNFRRNDSHGQSEVYWSLLGPVLNYRNFQMAPGIENSTCKLLFSEYGTKNLFSDNQHTQNFSTFLYDKEKTSTWPEKYWKRNELRSYSSLKEQQRYKEAADLLKSKGESVKATASSIAEFEMKKVRTVTKSDVGIPYIARHTSDSDGNKRNEFLVYNSTTSKTQSEHSLFWGGLFNYRETPSKTSASTLFGFLTDYNKEKTSSKDYTSWRLLKYLYRYEKRDENVTRDIFPAIKYDTSPGKQQFSFLGNLISYRKVNGKSSGHLFFIPWK